MTTALTVSTTLSGATVSDSLQGGGTGVDMGFLLEGEYSPIISQANNSGWKNLYIRHDGASPITLVKTFVGQFSQAYGGQATAALDFTSIKAKGLASDTSANNSTGFGAGLRIEQDADILGVLGVSAFDGTRSQVKIYGRDYGAGAQGIDLATGFLIHQDAMIYDNMGTPTDAGLPVAGQIGQAGNTTLGDSAYIKMRLYLEDNPPAAGVYQFDWVISYAFS